MAEDGGAYAQPTPRTLYVHDDLSDEIAAAEGAESLVENARARYGHVVLDVPGTRGDGFHLRLLPRVDSVVLVAAYDRTGKHPLARMAEVIQRQGGRIAGCILNRRREPIPEFLYRRLFW